MELFVVFYDPWVRDPSQELAEGSSSGKTPTGQPKKRVKRRLAPPRDPQVELLKQISEDDKKRAEERKQLLELEERKAAERDSVDVFFEFCALRVKKMPARMRSVVEMQIQQVLFNAENPATRQQIMDLPPDPLPNSCVTSCPLRYPASTDPVSVGRTWIHGNGREPLLPHGTIKQRQPGRDNVNGVQRGGLNELNKD